MISNREKDSLLLNTLVKYILPIFNTLKNSKGIFGAQKISSKFSRENNTKNKKKGSKLEELVKNEKTKLKPLALIFLEDLIDSLLKTNKEIKIIKKTEIQDFFEIEKNDNTNKDNELEIKYSIALERKKENRDNFAYSVSIKYEENENEEKLDVKVKLDNKVTLDNYSLNNKTLIKNNKNEFIGDKKEYSFVITKEKDKENKAKDNYSISLVYENNYEKERLNINYKYTIGTYLNKRQEALQDFTDRVPGKHMHILPESLMGGVLGFTYLGENFMARRADLAGEIAKMVDIHESIHTPNEYETRILTSWIMSKEMPKYIK